MSNKTRDKFVYIMILPLLLCWVSYQLYGGVAYLGSRFGSASSSSIGYSRADNTEVFWSIIIIEILLFLYTLFQFIRKK